MATDAEVQRALDTLISSGKLAPAPSTSTIGRGAQWLEVFLPDGKDHTAVLYVMSDGLTAERIKMADNPDKPYRDSATNPLSGGKKRDYSTSPLNRVFGEPEVSDEQEPTEHELSKEAHLQQVTRNLNNAYMEFEDALAELPKTREVSVATTHMQTAMLWLGKALEVLHIKLATERQQKAERND